MKIASLAAIALLSACLGAAPVGAGEVDSGDYTLRYNALSTQALPASAAARYGLSRSANQGLVVLVVERAGRNVAATATGRAATLLGQPVPLRFKTVNDASGTSILASFTVPDSGTLRFDIAATTADGRVLPLTFTHDFVAD